MYLYIKTHKTGLKYLGKTVQDPHRYRGSGTHWLRHLKKYGNEHSTEILFESNDKVLFKEKAIYYSNLFNVVDSKEWANIVPEQGDGGDTSNSPAYQEHIKSRKFLYGEKNGMYGKPCFYKMSESEKTQWKENISKSTKGKPKSAETRQKMKENHGRSQLGKTPWNKGKKGVQPKSLETKKKISIPVVFRGIEYYSIKEAARQNNLSDFLVKKEIYGDGFAKARQLSK